ncbi:hypothetical protein [Halobacterium sp. R2-5]|uniref:hypothetical protein n=1 Tax=Halobacterium sp. R2-5 TaxID=2715751 RepID=UPI0014238381|nr:hypothetical protein [Halobacterium sp. R2-5]NIB98041.1 hypothetical protein [Halobacterium sp. R2-5]
MEKPQFRERYLNENAWLPLGLEIDHIRQAIKAVYDRYHQVNEFHIEEFGTRFYDEFRAMNAVGDYVGHQFNNALIEQMETLEHNPHDDRRPDIIHSGFRAAAENRDKSIVDGIEQKAAHYRSFFTSHNESPTNILFLQYRVNAQGEIPEDEEPFEFTQILVADGGKYNWEFEDRGQGSNTTWRAADDLKDALRSNPLYQNPESICQNEHVERYRRIQASFDPVFAESNPEYVSEEPEMAI